MIKAALDAFDAAVSRAMVDLRAALAEPVTDPVVTPPDPVTDPDPVVDPPVVTDPPLPPVASDDVRYRCQTRQLFQDTAVPELTRDNMPGLIPLKLNSFGPSVTHVEGCGWLWANKGGDYIDADGVQQGPKPWATLTVDAAAVGETAEYMVDVTGLVVEAAKRDIPLAMLVKCKAPRVIDTRHGERPAMVSLRRGDETVWLRPLYIGSASTATPTGGNPTTTLPAFMEFERPEVAFDSATLHFHALTKARNANPLASIFLIHTDRSLPPLEDDIPDPNDLIGQHDYADSAALADYCATSTGVPWQDNVGAEANWDRAGIEGGPIDSSKYPMRAAGKWVGALSNENISLVKGTEIPWGAVAPGLGAMRIEVPRDPQAVEGANAARPGLLVSTLTMPLPEGDCGYLRTLHTRYYYAWDVPEGESTELALSDVVAVIRNGAPRWGSYGGKGGASGTHNTTAGGLSGSAGSGRGWQMRQSIGFPLTGEPGPMSGGLVHGWHLDDYRQNSLPGQVYAGVPIGRHGWGKVGGVLYARRWYCIETAVTLNSVGTVGQLSDGTPHLIDGVPQMWARDGRLQVWIDGMLVYDESGLSMRSLPVVKSPAGENLQQSIWPLGDLGHREVWLNKYIGGTSPSCKPWVAYYAALAWGRSYIGPMAGL